MQLYYLAGRGGRLQTGLGEALTARGLAVSGRETVGEFARLSFCCPPSLVSSQAARRQRTLCRPDHVS